MCKVTFSYLKCHTRSLDLTFPQSRTARKKLPKWSQRCSKHRKAPRKLPDIDLLSCPNGIRYCKFWQRFQQRSHHSLPGINWFATSRSSVCSLTTETEYHVHQTNFTTEFFHYNFRGKTCEFLSGNHSRWYLKENMIFWTKKVKILSYDPWQIVNGTPSTHKSMFLGVKLVKKIYAFYYLLRPWSLLNSSSPLLSQVELTLNLKDYFLSFKMIPNMTYDISKQGTNLFSEHQTNQHRLKGIHQLHTP